MIKLEDKAEDLIAYPVSLFGRERVDSLAIEPDFACVRFVQGAEQV